MITFNLVFLTSRILPQTGTLIPAAVWLGLRKGPQYLLSTALDVWLQLPEEPVMWKSTIWLPNQLSLDTSFALIYIFKQCLKPWSVSQYHCTVNLPPNRCRTGSCWCTQKIFLYLQAKLAYQEVDGTRYPPTSSIPYLGSRTLQRGKIIRSLAPSPFLQTIPEDRRAFLSTQIPEFKICSLKKNQISFFIFNFSERRLSNLEWRHNPKYITYRHLPEN
jgi:hypothetical protein